MVRKAHILKGMTCSNCLNCKCKPGSIEDATCYAKTDAKGYFFNVKQYRSIIGCGSFIDLADTSEYERKENERKWVELRDEIIYELL